MTTSQKHAKLKELSKKSKAALYERLKLTDEILRDPEYVDRFGSEVKLVEVLEADEWSDFAGRPGLWALLRAYRANPKRETWEEYRYDWLAMCELSRPEPDQDRGDRINWKAKFLSLELDHRQLQAEFGAVRERLAFAEGLLHKTVGAA